MYAFDPNAGCAVSRSECGRRPISGMLDFETCLPPITGEPARLYDVYRPHLRRRNA